MSLYLFFLITTVLLLASFNSAVCESKITINLGNGTKVDLESYIADLQVAASSIQYAANLNIEMVNKLQENLIKKEIDSQCNNKIKNIANKKFYELGELNLPWNAARKMCMDEGGQLAIIKNMKEFEILLSEIRKGKNFNSDNLDGKLVFIGIHRLFSENDWVTVTGESVHESMVWSPPFNETNKCGVITSEFMLSREDCHNPHRYLCEFIPKN